MGFLVVNSGTSKGSWEPGMTRNESLWWELVITVESVQDDIEEEIGA